MEKKIFFSTKYNEVNLRNGPGVKHLLIYKILKKGYPIKVIEEFDNWKRVVDHKKRTGWISNSQLTNKKFGILITNLVKVKKFPENESKTIGIARINLVFQIIKCKTNWCKIMSNKKKGWIQKDTFWGDKNP